MSVHIAESTLYLRLDETHSGAEAARHQRFIERDGPCIASIGTLAATSVERHLVWHVIDRFRHASARVARCSGPWMTDFA